MYHFTMDIAPVERKTFTLVFSNKPRKWKSTGLPDMDFVITEHDDIVAKPWQGEWPESIFPSTILVHDTDKNRVLAAKIAKLVQQNYTARAYRGGLYFRIHFGRTVEEDHEQYYQGKTGPFRFSAGLGVYINDTYTPDNITKLKQYDHILCNIYHQEIPFEICMQKSYKVFVQMYPEW